MELVEEKPKRKIWLYLIILVLIIAVVVVYFVFFGGGMSGTLGKITGQKQDFSLVPVNLQKDVTGGIVNLKFTPEDILQDPKYTSLQSYADSLELKTTPGRPNPFAPF